MSAILKRIAGALAHSPLFARARELAEQNQNDWTLPLGRWENLFVSLFLILSDYAAGSFPPPILDRAAAHESEIRYGRGAGNLSDPGRRLASEGLTSGLEFRIGAMEEVDRLVEPESFDAAYIFQALHHAFDWRAHWIAARK